MKSKKVLLIVDVQNDFCSGGALPVPQGDEVVDVLNKYIDFFQQNNFVIIASRDWHPDKTAHFREFGGAWPAHCVGGTAGAEFHSGLLLPCETIVVSKGFKPGDDGYSAFEASDENSNPLSVFLKSLGTEELYVGGLATDYCVKATVVDALKHGFKTYLLADAVKGVNIKPQDSRIAIDEMTASGAQSIVFDDFLKLDS